MVILNLMNYFNEKQKSSTMKILIILRSLEIITMFINVKNMIWFISCQKSLKNWSIDKCCINFMTGNSIWVLEILSWRVCKSQSHAEQKVNICTISWVFIDVSDGFCWRNILMTTLRCWRRICSFLSSTCCIFKRLISIK